MRSALRITNGAAGAISGFAIKKASRINVRLVDLISRQDARHRLALGLVAGVAVFFACAGTSSALECGNCRLECSRCRYPCA